MAYSQALFAFCIYSFLYFFILKAVHFILFLATPRSLRGLSCPTRDRTRDPCSGSAES